MSNDETYGSFRVTGKADGVNHGVGEVIAFRCYGNVQKSMKSEWTRECIGEENH